jgi:6-phosphofructokinase 1
MQILDLMPMESKTDQSGNKLHSDIGAFLKLEILKYFEEINMEIALKYIDPSYIIRASASKASDSLYCARLGSNAVHAALAGKTKCLVTLWNTHFVHLPISMVVKGRKRVDPESSLWRDVQETTRQPLNMTNK